MFAIVGGGGSIVEFGAGREPAVPKNPVTRGAVASGTLLREEVLGLRVRSPSELVNSSSSALNELALEVGEILTGALVKFTEGIMTPVLPVGESKLVPPTSEAFCDPEATGTVEGNTIPLLEAPEKKPVAPEVVKTAVPPEKEELKVKIGVALIDAGSEILADGGGIAPVDAASDESVLSSSVESGN